MDTRDMIRDFSNAFERPVNDKLVDLSKEDRVLLGKLLLEETLEYLVKGLGLKLQAAGQQFGEPELDQIELLVDGDREVDPIECADGLGDVNVIIHFNSNWQGINLDRVTQEIHESNMSKLDEYGKPIINEPQIVDFDTGREELMDPSRPAGKILKGPNFREPNLNFIYE